MVLNMAQTWHQLRPGEIRNDCGGCHAHSQKPTAFEDTAAAKPDYAVFDLTKQTPLLTSKKIDQSGKKWDVKDETGLRFETGRKNVEYHRDVKPILERSCVACHTQKSDKPAGNLVLDDDAHGRGPEPGRRSASTSRVPGTYARLAADAKGEYGIKPLHRHGWTEPDRLALRSRDAVAAQPADLEDLRPAARRLDNDDFVHETVPGDPTSLRYQGKPVPDTPQNRERIEIAYTGSIMPPPEAVAGTYVGPDGKKIKVPRSPTKTA